MSAHTPGPLTVKVADKWPFRIETFDAAGELVFCRDMPCYSTKQKSAKECMDGLYLGDLAEHAASVNAKAVADEVLRAAAPELLEALKDLRAAIKSRGVISTVKALSKAGAAIAKVTGAAS